MPGASVRALPARQRRRPGEGDEPARVATPEGLTLGRHRDLEGRERRPFVRWALLALLTAYLVLGLLGVFGQRPSTARAAGDDAELELSAPDALRSGLYFQARVRVSADEELEDAVLVLDGDWLEGVTLNTVEPAPVGEASRDGRIALELGRVPAGDEHVLYLHFQVNPTTTGRRAQRIDLYDAERLVATVDRTVTIWP